MFSLKTRGRGNEEDGAVSCHSLGMRWGVPLTIA